jgi:hypothetical protein
MIPSLCPSCQISVSTSTSKITCRPIPKSTPDQVADALVAAHGEAFFANKHLCKQLIAERVLKEILRLIEEDEL